MARRNFTGLRQHTKARKSFDLLYDEISTEAGVRNIEQMDILKFFALLIEGTQCGSVALVQLLIKIRSDHIKKVRRRKNDI